MCSLLARVCSRYVKTAVRSCRQGVIRTQQLHSFTASATRLFLYRHLCLTSRLASTRSMATGSDPPPAPKKSLNRLAHEKSPYLLQHAGNPVDWWVEHAGRGRRACTLFHTHCSAGASRGVQSAVLLASSCEAVLRASSPGSLIWYLCRQGCTFFHQLDM